MINEKQLRAAAAELNDVLGLDPAINTKKSSVEVLTEKIKEATDLIDPDQDEFTEETQQVLDEVTGKAGDDKDEAPKAKAGKKAPAKPAKKEEPDEDEDDDEDDDDEDDEDDDDEADDEPTLRAQITDAEDLAELKEIAKANSEFKSLVKKLSSFVKAKVLRPAMLDLIEDEDDEAAEKAAALHKKNVAGKKPTTGKAKAKDEDDDDEDEAPKKKKASPIKSAGKDGGPGIIQTIVALVEKAGKKGISKKEILEVLKENFPDRNEVSMKNTVNVQVPARINKEKFPIKKVGEDRYTKA